MPWFARASGTGTSTRCGAASSSPGRRSATARRSRRSSRPYVCTLPPTRRRLGPGRLVRPRSAPAGLFDARWLDAAVPDRPVMLEASDHHCAWLNTAALQACGITAETPDPPASQDRPPAGRQPDGDPRRVGGRRPRQGARPAARRRGATCRPSCVDPPPAAAGVTWAQEAAATAADLATYLRQPPRETSRFAPTSLCAPSRGSGTTSSPSSPRRARAQAAQTWSRRAPSSSSPTGSSRRAVPLYSSPTRTRRTRAAFRSGSRPSSRRRSRLSTRTASRRTSTPSATRAYAPPSTRSRTPREERSSRPPTGHRAHAARGPSDLARFASLGVVANFEPLWMCLEPGMTELTLPRLGNRSSIHYPTGALSRSGAHLSFGSDWPVSSLRPLDGLAVAVTRQTTAGDPPGSGRRRNG